LHNATYLPLGDVQSRVLVRHLGDLGHLDQ
jgi:hypothetical protein